MLEKIFDAIVTNLKNPKLYVFALCLIIIVVMLFPYIDANIFYHQRISNRVETLSQISEIDFNKISDNDILMQEYNSILQEISKQKEGSLGSVFVNETDHTVSTIKFISGGFLFWLLALCCPFIKTFKSKRDSILALLLVGGIGFVFAALAKALPTVINPFVNYIGFPLIILVIVGILATTSSKKKG